MQAKGPLAYNARRFFQGWAMSTEDPRFAGVARLYGQQGLQRLREAHVAVVGIGGVGSWAVQLAQHFGAHVTAVCSTSKVEFVRTLGAASVIDYTTMSLPRDGHFDVILDLAGNRPLSVLRMALASRGTLVIGGGEDGDRFFGGMGRTLRAALWSMFLKQRLAMLVGFVKPEPLQALANILGQPGVTPAVDRTFPLEQVADAMRTLVAAGVESPTWFGGRLCTGSSMAC